eukprot:5322831-Pyramimonas_sp.AAC.1
MQKQEDNKTNPGRRPGKPHRTDHYDIQSPFNLHGKRWGDNRAQGEKSPNSIELASGLNNKMAQYM